MIVLVTVTIGLVLWVTAWAFGIKAFDAFIFVAIAGFAAAAVQVALPYVRQVLAGQPAPPDDR